MSKVKALQSGWTKDFTNGIGTRCPEEDKHSPEPIGYLARAEYAEEMLKTHRQWRCRACHLWALWLPKGEHPSYINAQTPCGAECCR